MGRACTAYGKENSFEILDGKRTLGRRGHRWKDGITTNHKNRMEVFDWLRIEIRSGLL
jgi:hypothetical protein